jgi:hypothetical protein
MVWVGELFSAVEGEGLAALGSVAVLGTWFIDFPRSVFVAGDDLVTAFSVEPAGMGPGQLYRGDEATTKREGNEVGR